MTATAFKTIGKTVQDSSIMYGLYGAVENVPGDDLLLSTKRVINLSPEKTIREARSTTDSFPKEHLYISETSGKPCLPCLNRTAFPIIIISGSEKPEERTFYVTKESIEAFTTYPIPRGYYRERDERFLAREVTDLIATYLNTRYGRHTSAAFELYENLTNGERVC